MPTKTDPIYNSDPDLSHFPLAAYAQVGTVMTLRDWFAGQALAGMRANPALDLAPKDYVKGAYFYAAMMLDEREGK
jgi:hypothetical protein